MFQMEAQLQQSYGNWNITTNKQQIRVICDKQHWSFTDLLDSRLRRRPSIFMTTSTSESASRRNKSSLPNA